MIRLSKHIADDLDRRGNLLDYIETALLAPDRIAADPSDPALSRSFKVIPAFGDRVLRVVHRPDGDGQRAGGIFVVPAHWDRGAKVP